jgi:hypothetical protein
MIFLVTKLHARSGIGANIAKLAWGAQNSRETLWCLQLVLQAHLHSRTEQID